MFKCLGSLVLKAFLASILENIPEKNEIIGILPLSPISKIKGIKGHNGIKRNWKEFSSKSRKSGRWISGVDTPSNLFVDFTIYLY